MWWTSSTGVNRPSCKQRSHRGCAAAYLSRIRFQARPYFRFTSAARSYLLYCRSYTSRCSSQYCPPSTASRGQPGAPQDRRGFLGIFHHHAFHGIVKARVGITPDVGRFCMLFYNTIIAHMAMPFYAKVCQVYSGTEKFCKALPWMRCTVLLDTWSIWPISSQERFSK